MHDFPRNPKRKKRKYLIVLHIAEKLRNSRVSRVKNDKIYEIRSKHGNSFICETQFMEPGERTIFEGAETG